MNLYYLCVHDKKSGNLFAFINSYDIEQGVKWIIEHFVKELENIPGVSDYEIVKVGYLDIKKKEFINEFESLYNLSNLLINNGSEVSSDEV